MTRQLEVPTVPAGFLVDGGSAVLPLVAPPTAGVPSLWTRFQRLVRLSWLGWAFVAAGVFWELFALAFSQRVGWLWDRGVLIFIWGVGIFAFGLLLRSKATRPALSRLFLAVNLIVVSVFAWLVATS